MKDVKLYYGCYFCRVSQLTLREENMVLANSILSPRHNVEEIYNLFTNPYIFPKVDNNVTKDDLTVMKINFYRNIPSFGDQHKRCEIYSVILFEGGKYGVNNSYDDEKEPSYRCQFFLIEGDPLIFSSLFLWRNRPEEGEIIFNASDEYQNFFECNHKNKFSQKTNNIFNKFTLSQRSNFKTIFEAENPDSHIHLTFGTIWSDYTVLNLDVKQKDNDRWYNLGKYRYVSCIDDSTYLSV